MKTPIKFEYVASACGYAKFFAYDEDSDIELEAVAYLAHCLKALQNRHNHNLSLLFNAYTELEIAKQTHKYVRSSAHRVYGDSGGLQVVSRGFKVSPELKDEVYEKQADYCDVAMCFDDIPVKVLYTVSNPNFIGNRVFDRATVVKCATNTANNIKRQIEIFDKKGSSAMPNVIMQGNDHDSFQLWADTIVSVLGDDYLNKCSGMSLADTAHGIGLLDDVDRMFTATQMQVPESLSKHIHLLGIGRIRRLLPIVIFAENGLLPQTKIISYDSSTHTRQLTIGYHFFNNVMFNFGKNVSAYHMVADNIKTQSQKLFGYTPPDDILHDVLVKGARITHNDGSGRKTSEYIRDLMKTCMSCVLVSIDNFCYTVHNTMTDNKVLTAAVLDSKNEFVTLRQVTNSAEYKEWYTHCTRRLKSTKVKASEPTSLDLF